MPEEASRVTDTSEEGRDLDARGLEDEPRDAAAPAAAGGGLSRREFIGGAAALAAGLALPAALAGPAGAAGPDAGPALAAGPDANEAAGRGKPSRRPNIIILMTDQERVPMHWPDGWADENLPNRARLARRGLTFTNHFCAASMCSPSRATIFTGVYPAEHGVTEVLQDGTSAAAVAQHTLQPSRKNLADLLASAGYDVQYRGKWHMSKDPSGTMFVQSRHDLEHYRFRGWQPPDAGADQSAAMLGGGTADWDGLTAAQAASFLKSADPTASRPFALIVSFVNPHDIMACPPTWEQPSLSDIAPYQGSANYADVYPECVQQGIRQPSTVDEILRTNHKPHCQYESTEMWSAGLGPVRTPERMREYVNFYAYLHKRSDEDMGTVLDALEGNKGLWDRTIVIRLSDHGEMGLAHGGMREKAYNAYEETIHVPLVVSNPKLFPKAVETDCLASTVDLMPTLAGLADVPRKGDWTFRGKDLSPIIRSLAESPGKPAKPVQDSVLFTTDEVVGSGEDEAAGAIVTQPAHIRCLREARWKLAMYFDPSGEKDPLYELYDLEEDPDELRNMGASDGPYYDPTKVAEMQQKLAARMRETATTPPVT
jgi:arylsulfatase A-like enzyme